MLGWARQLAQDACLLAGRGAMSAGGARDQRHSAYQQNQHEYRIEEAGGLKINVHVGYHTGKNKEGSSDGEQPADGAPAFPEENSNPKQKWYERQPEGVRAPQVP